MLLPVENEDLESIVTSCRSAHTVQCSREWCLTCFCAAAGSSLFQCSSNDLIYNKLHAEAFPEVVSSASAGDEINNPTTGKSTAAVIIENQATTPAEIQTLLARIALVSEEGGDMLGVVAEIQEWLLSLPDTDEVGSWVNLCVTLSKLYKDTIGEARGISDELHRNQKILLDKLEVSEKALTDLQKASDRRERILVDKLHDEQNVLASQRKAWDDHEMILRNQLEEEKRALIDLLQTSHLNESTLVSKLEESTKALTDLEQTSNCNKRTLVDKLNDERNVLTRQRKAWDDQQRILCNKIQEEQKALANLQQTSHSTENALADKLAKAEKALNDLKKTYLCSKRTLGEKLEETRNSLINLQERVNKITPTAEELHALLERIDSVLDGVEDVEDVISSTKEWLDQRDPDPDVSFTSLCIALTKLCRCQADKARKSCRNENRIFLALQETRQIAKALRTEGERNKPAAGDIQRLQGRISLIMDDEDEKLTDEEEFAAIDEVRDWFAARPDADSNSISRVGSTLAQLCRDKIGKTWDLWTNLQKSRSNEEGLEEQLREVEEDLETSREKEVKLADQLDQAQAVARALQDELHQALDMYRAANPHSRYEMTVIRTDPDYIDALGRICRR